MNLALKRETDLGVVQNSAELASAINELKYFDGRYKRECVEIVLQHREEAVPALIAIIHEILKNPTLYLSLPNRFGHVYALILLAYLEDSRALTPIIELFSAPDDLDYRLYEYSLGNEISALLYRASSRNVTKLQEIVLNPKQSEFIRVSAAEALGFCVVDDLVSREEIYTFLLSFFSPSNIRNQDYFIIEAAPILYDLDPFRAEPILELIEKYRGRITSSPIDAILHGGFKAKQPLIQLGCRISLYDIEDLERLHKRLERFVAYRIEDQLNQEIDE